MRKFITAKMTFYASFKKSASDTAIKKILEKAKRASVDLLLKGSFDGIQSANWTFCCQQ